MSVHQSSRRWSSPRIVGLLVLGVLLALWPPIDLRERVVANQQTVETASRNRRSDGGFVLADPNCGCEELRRDAPKGLAPTRCRGANKYTSRRPYRPENEKGQSYPQHTYPKGFPYSYTYARSLPWAGTAVRGASIPFPGWPAVKPRRSADGVSSWNSTKREKYKNDYEKVNDAKPPGLVGQGFSVIKTEAGWEDWQIHHILERKHNGTDDDQNLVPVYAYPESRKKGYPGSNRHKDFTQWWQNIQVDSEFSRRPKIWSQIEGCAVVQWPM